MKKTAILFISICFSLIKLIHGQSPWEWSEPVTITDSISFNSNPNLVSGTSMLFYEKKFEFQSPSSIYYTEIGTDIEIAILSDETVTYRNPQPAFGYYNHKYLFFESDASGNFDIYALEYLGNGIFGDTIQITNTTEEESSLSIFLSRDATWLSYEQVNVAEFYLYQDSLYFDNVVIIDNQQSANPVLSYSGLIYQKYINSEYHIYKSIYNDTTWGSPQPVYSIGNNINLGPTRVFWDEYLRNAVWENNGNILYYNEWYNEVETIELNGIDSASQPYSFYYFITTDDNYNATLSFTEGIGNNQEIYILNKSMGTDLVNISNNNVKDENSKLFEGPYDGMGNWWFYCIWQSHKNEHTVLYYSREPIMLGEIDENKDFSSLSLYPNPFKDQLTIKYQAKNNKKSTIEIFTITGKKIFSKEVKNNLNMVEQVVTWNPDDEQINLPEGVYLVKLTQGEYSSTEKVVYRKP